MLQYRSIKRQIHLYSGDTSTYCKDNWEENGGSCFYWSKKYLNWTEAEEFCSEQGGIVAKGVKISTDKFPPQKNSACFSHAFPKN